MRVYFSKNVVYTLGLSACLFLASCSDKEQQADPNLIELQETAATLISSLISVEATPFTLLSSIPDRNIYLYGDQSDKVVLQVGDHKQEYNWIYTTPRLIMPSMQVDDYDEDGKDELAVVLNVGSGTGVSLYELHMVEIEEDNTLFTNIDKPFMINHTFSPVDYLAQIREAVSFTTLTKSNELIGRISVGNDVHTVSLKAYQSEGYDKISDDLTLGNIVRFEAINNKLSAVIGVGIVIENMAEPQYIGYLFADVTYKTGEFRLNHFHFREEQ